MQWALRRCAACPRISHPAPPAPRSGSCRTNSSESGRSRLRPEVSGCRAACRVDGPAAGPSYGPSPRSRSSRSPRRRRGRQYEPQVGGERRAPRGGARHEDDRQEEKTQQSGVRRGGLAANEGRVCGRVRHSDPTIDAACKVLRASAHTRNESHTPSPPTDRRARTPTEEPACAGSRSSLTRARVETARSRERAANAGSSRHARSAQGSAVAAGFACELPKTRENARLTHSAASSINR